MAKVNEHGVSEREGRAWGHGEFANMPKKTKMDMYPKNRGQTGVLDDTITGIDRSIGEAETQSKRHQSNQH